MTNFVATIDRVSLPAITSWTHPILTEINRGGMLTGVDEAVEIH